MQRNVFHLIFLALEFHDFIATRVRVPPIELLVDWELLERREIEQLVLQDSNIFPRPSPLAFVFVGVVGSIVGKARIGSLKARSFSAASVFSGRHFLGPCCGFPPLRLFLWLLWEIK